MLTKRKYYKQKLYGSYQVSISEMFAINFLLS